MIDVGPRDDSNNAPAIISRVGGRDVSKPGRGKDDDVLSERAYAMTSSRAGGDKRRATAEGNNAVLRGKKENLIGSTRSDLFREG